jgi:hypothetical protein
MRMVLLLSGWRHQFQFSEISQPHGSAAKSKPAKSVLALIERALARARL